MIKIKLRHACVWLILSLLCILLPSFPVQADNNTLEWAKVNKPGLSGNIVVSPSEVSEIAVGRRGTIYATDNESLKVYQSTNGGASWEDITARLVEAGATLPASKIAIAPDTTSTVAAVTNSGSDVYLSFDGGANWSDANIPGLTGTIQAITISRQYTESEESWREVAVGTANWGDNTTTGQLWVLQLGTSVSSWQNQKLTVDPNHLGGEVSAIAYSPNYQRDDTIIVISSTGNDTAAGYQNKTWLCLGKRDIAAGTTAWNDNAFTNYPAAIASAGDDTGACIYSSLALPSNYYGSDEALRNLFVSYDRTPDANDDVYRLDDTVPYRLNANSGANINISSIAYYGTTTSGKLLAGDMNPVTGSPTVQMRRTANPFDSPPTWRRATVPPTGPGSAKVSWSPEGDIAYCGTGQSPRVARDESAFSMSTDDGDNWQQLSLIDTTITLSDIVPAPDGKTLFAATYTALGPEGVWRSASTTAGIGVYWSRQLTMNTTSNRIILRLSPNYASDYTIYAAEAGGDLMAVSHNRGNSWKRCRAPDAAIDIVVEDENTIYAALPGGRIGKSTNDAFTWGEPMPTGLRDINMLAIANNGTLLIGGRKGEVAYTSDGGASFTRIDEDINAGDVQVIADANYQNNGIIYAAANVTDSGIWRWTVGLSAHWEQIDEPMSTLNTGQRIGGLAMGVEGTLYALRQETANGTSGGITRSPNPAEPYEPGIEFGTINDALPAGTSFNATTVFTHTLPYLKLSWDTGQNDLWAIDTSNEIIYRFQDTLARLGPRLTNPTNGDVIPMITLDDRIYPTLSWDSLPWVTEYEVGIYLAPHEAQKIWAGTSNTTGLAITTDNKLPPLGPGITYYWQVRAIKPITSLWSETWSFVSGLSGIRSPLLLSSPFPDTVNVPLKPAFAWNSIDGATGYEFMLSSDSKFTEIDVAFTGENALTVTYWNCDRDLDYSTTYFWKVRAISAESHSEWVNTTFTTVSETIAETPQVVVETSPSTIPSPPPAPKPVHAVPPYLWWVLIGLGTALVASLVVLIVRTR